jgi:hypothetical protein
MFPSFYRQTLPVPTKQKPWCSVGGSVCLTEEKRVIADSAGNRIPVIQHITSDTFVTVTICICLLKSGPDGQRSLWVSGRVQVWRQGYRQQLNLTVTNPAGVYIYGHTALFRCGPGWESCRYPPTKRETAEQTCFVRVISQVRSLDWWSNIITGFSHKVHSSSRKTLYYYLK